MRYIWFVPDPTLSAIDRFFDFVDSGVVAFKHAFQRGERVEEKHGTRRTKPPAVIDAVAAPKAKRAAAASTALARSSFYIAESVTSSGTVFVVTDGGTARTECATREFAERVLHALGAKS